MNNLSWFLNDVVSKSKRAEMIRKFSPMSEAEDYEMEDLEPAKKPKEIKSLEHDLKQKVEILPSHELESQSVFAQIERINNMFKNYLTPASQSADEDLSIDGSDEDSDDDLKSQYSKESMLKKVGVILTYISV